ncbi:MAG: hypothetical protein AB7U79_08830 [Candidatus Izemoplasmatales bacterium]
MKKVVFLFFLFMPMIMMNFSIHKVYACDEYPGSYPLPPNLVCQILDEQSMVDPEADPSIESYVTGYSSVVLLNQVYAQNYHNTSTYKSQIDIVTSY